MRKKLLPIVFVLLLNCGSAFADIQPLPPSSVKEEEKKQGICFSPTVVGGVFLSLSLIVFGLRFLRRKELESK